MKNVGIDEIGIENKRFWHGFFLSSYPCAYSDELDLSLNDLADKISDSGDLKWWNEFTGWYDGILEECDGYLDEPAYVEADFLGDKLKVEFHPGDICFYLNGTEIGSTGPCYKLNSLPFDRIKAVEKCELFWLVLPLAIVGENDKNAAVEFLADRLTEIFDESICKTLATVMVSQFIID